MKFIINNLYIFLNFFLSKCLVILAYWCLSYLMYSSPTFSSLIFFILCILLLIRVIFWIEKIDFQEFSLLLYFDSNIRNSLNYFIIMGKMITFFFILFNSFFFILFVFCSLDTYSFCMQPTGDPENANPAPIAQVEPLVPERELVEAKRENFNLLKTRLQDSMDQDSISQANRAENVRLNAQLQEQAEARLNAQLQEVADANRAETAGLNALIEQQAQSNQTLLVENGRLNVLAEELGQRFDNTAVLIAQKDLEIKTIFDANKQHTDDMNASIKEKVYEANQEIQKLEGQIENLRTLNKKLIVSLKNNDNVASTGELGSIIKENITKKDLTVDLSDNEDRNNSSDDDERSLSQVSGATLSGIALFTFFVTCLVAFINGG